MGGTTIGMPNRCATRRAAILGWRPPMIHEILVPLDTSPLAERALPHVRALAAVFGARIHLLSVVERPAGGSAAVDSVDWRLARDENDAYLERVAAGLRQAGLEVDRETAGGAPAEQILESGRARGVDLIALTTHGRGGITDFPLSGTASKVVAGAETSVLLVRATAAGTADEALAYERILAPVDCSPRGDWAACFAAQLARAHQAELLLVAVVETPRLLGSPHQWSEQAKLARRLADLNRKIAERHLDVLAGQLDAGRRPLRKLVVEHGDAARALHAIAQEEGCSLVVLSAHGRSAGAGWPYGSVPRDLLEHSDLPVLVVQDVRASARHDDAAAARERLCVGP
jgi:nucleotide-binding universal stress UspA family protein